MERGTRVQFTEDYKNSKGSVLVVTGRLGTVVGVGGDDNVAVRVAGRYYPCRNVPVTILKEYNA